MKLNWLQRLCLKRFSHDFNSSFRWYRQYLGGFWVHSTVMGWEQRPRDSLGKSCDLMLLFGSPHHYDYGRDIEFYEPIKEDIKRIYIEPYTDQLDQIRGLLEQIEIDEREGDHWTVPAVLSALKDIL